MRRWLLLALLASCSEVRGTLPKDGGGFVLPDGGMVTHEDASAPVDAGFMCDPACTGQTFCGCAGGACGCLPPAALGGECLPDAPTPCAAGRCVDARRAEGRIFLCSDGAKGAACSRDSEDVCTTKLGCVCLTNLTTVCTCQDDIAANDIFCDRQKATETCPSGTCVRDEVQGGVRYVCSDGSAGQPCEPNDGSCMTSLGCTCPRVKGRDDCRCSEPGAAGDYCDISVGGSCTAPLECVPKAEGPGQISSVCGDRGFDAGVSNGCDPNDPLSCPEGYVCVQMGPQYQCRMF